MTIMISIMQFLLMPLVGLTQGAQPIISYNYGANRLERVKRTFRLLFISSMTYSTLMWALCMLFPSCLCWFSQTTPHGGGRDVRPSHFCSRPTAAGCAVLLPADAGGAGSGEGVAGSGTASQGNPADPAGSGAAHVLRCRRHLCLGAHCRCGCGPDHHHGILLYSEKTVPLPPAFRLGRRSRPAYREKAPAQLSLCRGLVFQ